MNSDAATAYLWICPHHPPLTHLALRLNRRKRPRTPRTMTGSPPLTTRQVRLLMGARALVAVAKLNRIAREAELVLRIHREAESNGMGGFLFCDLQEIDATTSAGRLILGVMASVAEFESRRISERTREALAAAKARGVKLGGKRPRHHPRERGGKGPRHG